MKNKIIALSVLLSILSGGCVNMQQSKDLLTIDVTKDYPQKEFALQDIFDIDYIPLDTSRTFTTMGYMQDISKDMIIVRNLKLSSDGDIFIFDRKGKGIRKINRQGSGSEEYSFLLRVTLDEEHEELFVVDNRSKKVYIYDLQGNFKRSFKNIEGASYDRVFNLGSDYLICNDGDNLFTDEIKNIFYIISKQDGRLIKEIHIPYDKKKTSLIINKEQTKSARPRNEEFVPFHDSWILMDHSSDTIYRVFTDKRVVPFIARTPSAYLVAIPKNAATIIQNNAPGPPAHTAVATPTILPVPIVALRAVQRAAKLDISPVASSSFLIIHFNASGSFLI